MENEYIFQQLHPINLYNYDGLQINAESKKIEEKTISHLANALNQAAADKRSSLTPQAKRANAATPNVKQATKKNQEQNKDQDQQNESPQKDDYSSYKQAQLNLSKLGPKELKFIDIYSQSKYTFVVRIPFKNPCTSSSYSHLQSKYYLYINSRKPQDYWELKGTTLVAYKQIF